jgi:hypothetical protein
MPQVKSFIDFEGFLVPKFSVSEHELIVQETLSNSVRHCNHKLTVWQLIDSVGMIFCVCCVCVLVDHLVLFIQNWVF